MFLAILLKIFSGSLLALKIVNTIIICLIPVIIYLIINKLTLEKYARISSILYSIYISSIINSSVLTNQNLATLLFYLALYILIINIKHKWILVGITLGLGNIIRPEAPIILIAIFLFLIFINFADFEIIKKNILSFIGILFTLYNDKFNYSFLFLIILIGYFLAHLILEVQPRYRYFAIPIFFIMAAYGFTKSKLTYKFLKE